MIPNNLNNFIPQRLRGQTFSIGKIPLMKVLISLVFLVCPFLIIWAVTRGNPNQVAIVIIAGLIFALFGQVLVWFPTRSGHTLLKLLWYMFDYNSSYNNFKNATECEIFDIYKLKTTQDEVLNNIKLKYSQLVKNDDGSYSPKPEFLIQDDTLNKNLSPNTLILKQGHQSVYTTMIKINGYDITHSNEETKVQLLMGLHNVFRSISLPHSLIKIKQPTNLNENIKQANFNYEILEKRTALTNQLAIKRDIMNLDRQALQKDVFTYTGENLENNWYLVIYHTQSDDIELLANNIINQLNGLKIGTIKLDRKQIINVLVSIYAPYIAFDDENIININKSHNFSSLLQFNELKFNPSTIEIVPKIDEYYPSLKGTKTYMKVGTIDKYPETDLPFGWLFSLSTAVDTLIIHNKPLPKLKVQKLLHSAFQNTELTHGMTRNKAKQKESAILYQNFEKLSNAIGSGAESIFDTTIYTINYSLNSNKECYESYRQSESAIKGFGFILRPLTFEQRKGFSDLFIKPNLFLERYLFPLPAFVYATSYPFISTTINDINGVMLGKTDKKEYFIFDLFNLNIQRTNANQFVVGKSGAGKSTYLKKLWMHEYGKGTKIILIDPENENKSIVKALGGTQIDISSSPINPMEINIFSENSQGQYQYDIDAKVGWLVSWFSVIFGWTDNQEDNFKKTYLNDYLVKFYHSKQYQNYIEVDKIKDLKFPTIGEFYDFLKQIVTIGSAEPNRYERDIISLFELNFINTEQLTKTLWNSSNSFDVSSSDLINFDISKIQNLPDNLKRAMYMFVLDLANKEIWKNRLWNDKERETLKFKNPHDKTYFKQKNILLIVDEAHLLIDKKNPQALEFLAETIKRIRKYQGGVITATQNIGDFVSDPEILKQSTALINNVQSAVSLGLAPNDIDAINKLWAPIGGLTEQERVYLGTAQKGDCLYIVGGFNRIQLKIDIANDVAFGRYANLIKVDK